MLLYFKSLDFYKLLMHCQKNITFVGNGVSTSNNGARIKVWAGPVGSAIVNDVHYEDLSVRYQHNAYNLEIDFILDLQVENVTNPIVVDSCYFSQPYCTTVSSIPL